LVTENNTLFGDPEVSSSLQQSNETACADIPEEEVDLNGKKKSYSNKFVIKYQE
jgi:hypothetical protein